MILLKSVPVNFKAVLYLNIIIPLKKTRKILTYLVKLMIADRWRS